MSDAPAVRPGLPPYAHVLGLSTPPFPVTPDETHYFFTPQGEAVFEEMRHFIELRKGFMLLTGDIGLGKTTLLRRLLASFDPAHYNTALILTSFLDPSELLESIARDFGLVLPPAARRLDHLNALGQFLMSEAQAGKTNVLFIDDAQALGADALDVVRQLSNLETAQAKLIQVVLSGQPELLEALDQHALRQVKSRIALHRQLQPLDLTQTGAYIQHRLHTAGLVNELEIPAAALARLHQLSGGFPRRIHHLMDRCLYAWMAQDGGSFSSELVQQAWDDLGGQALPPPMQAAPARAGHDAALPVAAAPAVRGPKRLWLAGLLGLVLGSALLHLYTGTPPGAAQPQTEAVQALPQPPQWEAFRARYTGLTGLSWPQAEQPEELAQQLRRQLRQAQPPSQWQVLLAPDDWAASCASHPMLPLGPGPHPAWSLALVPAAWPVAPMTVGEFRESLKPLQLYLNQRGWLAANSADGIMGPRTSEALARFQADQGLANTGQFDGPTAYRLLCAQDAGAQVTATGTGDGGRPHD